MRVFLYFQSLVRTAERAWTPLATTLACASTDSTGHTAKLTLTSAPRRRVKTERLARTTSTLTPVSVGWDSPASIVKPTTRIARTAVA